VIHEIFEMIGQLDAPGWCSGQGKRLIDERFRAAAHHLGTFVERYAAAARRLENAVQRADQIGHAVDQRPVEIEYNGLCHNRAVVTGWDVFHRDSAILNGP
jgi:hypothetical protein